MGTNVLYSVTLELAKRQTGRDASKNVINLVQTVGTSANKSAIKISHASSFHARLKFSSNASVETGRRL